MGIQSISISLIQNKEKGGIMKFVGDNYSGPGVYLVEIACDEFNPVHYAVAMINSYSKGKARGFIYPTMNDMESFSIHKCVFVRLRKKLIAAKDIDKEVKDLFYRGKDALEEYNEK